MKEVTGQPGFFEMDVTSMPYGPEQLFVPRYVLAQTYGRQEPEEAAARLIVLCQQVGYWCGVSVPRFLKMVQGEYQEHMEQEKIRNEAQKHNWSEQQRYNNELIYFIVLCFVTLGLHALLGRRPAQPVLKTIPEIQCPFSSAIFFGPRMVLDGLSELVGKGFLQVERHEDGYNIVFPTPGLLAPLDAYRKA